MRLHRLTITLTCLVFAAACTDDTQDDAADEVGTESSTEESGSTETESGSSTEESGSTEAESESESASTTETADDPGTTETESTDAPETETESTETESTETESTTNDTLDEESTSTTSDTGVMSCEDVEAAYEALVTNNTGCVLDEQCHVVNGHCWMGLGGCWYIVNDNVKQTDLEELADAYVGFDCFGPVCACLPPPNNVGCIDGTCLSL